MGLKKEEIVLYALGFIKDVEDLDIRFVKEQMSDALDISLNTFDLYMTKLSNRGLIIRSKKHFIQDIRRSYEISDEGEMYLEEIRDDINSLNLTPERHNIPAVVPLKVIMDRINDPLERIFFLALYSKLKRFDLPFYLETIKTSKAENNIIRLMDEMEEGAHSEEGPVVNTFFQTCFYGIHKDSEILDNSCTDQNPSTLLIIAEASFRQGRYGDARMIYNHLISGKIPISQNQWTIASINLAFLKSKEGSSKEAIADLDGIIEQSDNKILRAYTVQMKARVHAANMNHEIALDLYTNALNSFKTFGLPLLQAITHINRGVVYFRLDENDKAEEEWQKSRKIAKRISTPFVEGCSISNLSSIEREKGNFDKALKYLDSYYEYFREIGDLETQAYLDFNYSLLYLDMKDKERAQRFFRLSETIAYPSPSPKEREERRRAFQETGEKNGFHDLIDYNGGKNRRKKNGK